MMKMSVFAATTMLAGSIGVSAQGPPVLTLSEAVNEALRGLVQVAKESVRLTTRSSGPGKLVGRKSALKK